MGNDFTSLQMVSAIKPKHIFLAETGQALIGTLGNREFEQLAARLVYESQVAGSWVPHMLCERAHWDTTLGTMVRKGFISEARVGDGRWMYWLTLFAISQIYLVQSETVITSLQAQLRREREESLFSRIKRHLKGVFVPMSPSI